MQTLARREAVEKLIQAVPDMPLDDLLDFHNELFPEEPKADPGAPDGGDSVRRKVLEYLRRGIEVEEILDLWNVAFPETWNVSYDEDSDTIQYLIEPEAVRQADERPW